jgi:outer membrane protein assembly factor BamB
MHHRSTLSVAAVLAVVAFISAAAIPQDASSAATDSDWPWWGGPRFDWKPATPDLADTWPESGPPVVWRRPLGEGYSAISVLDGNLYTMLRNGETETVVAMSAADGKTLWEFTYDSPTAGYSFDRGSGPHSTPAATADRVFAIGSTGKFHALDRAKGTKLWGHDLIGELKGGKRHRGYSSSPLVHGDVVIVVVGGEGGTVVAFKQSDGSVAWRGGADDSSYSSPILIDVSGERQLVSFASTRVIGFDPDDGNELWSHPHLTRNAFNISTPLWSAEDGILFMSSAYDGGGRAIQLAKAGDGATAVKELWFSNQVRIHFGTAIRLGDTVYASSGDFGPAPMTAVDVATGEVLWRDRTFAKHSLLYADGKLVLLDEDGALGLVDVNRQGMTVKARSQVFNSLSWTVPTLVGTRLYVRNREEIAVFDLGPAGAAAPSS